MDYEHSQSSTFFAEEKKYMRFEQYLAKNHIDPKRVPFTELSFKVCGYGYFQKYKQHMKQKFRQYLWQATNACPDLTALKIIFNGFNINTQDKEREQIEQDKVQEEHIFLDILESIENISRKKKLKVVEIHTTNLRKCTEKDLIRLFALVSSLGSQASCEEISIQLADWQFEGGYPEYKRLDQIFSDFVRGNPEVLKFKKFRLEMSCWYMKQKQAYKFLTNALTPEQLIEKFKKEQKILPLKKQAQNTEQIQQQQQPVNDAQFPNLPLEQQQETLDALTYFVQNVDKRYLEPKYPYKKNSEQYDMEAHKAHDFMLEELQRCQGILSERLVKYPVEFIQQARVEEFHSKMVNFLGNLLVKLKLLTEYYIDFRNWNSIFSMSALKKTLDTRVVSNKQQFSLIRKSLMAGNNKPMKEGEDQGLKTIYTM